ncbi:MAG: M15 family metallopeptidase [Eubacteriales bacterium]|nr:M15 family metallopeptidase [Eubacteriales bacterium]
MENKKENKTITILIVILCIVLFVGICLMGVLCYLSYDMNKKLSQKKLTVEQQVEEAEQKLAELQTQRETLEKEIAEKKAELETTEAAESVTPQTVQKPQAETPTESLEQNAMIHPPAGQAEVSLEMLEVGETVDASAVAANKDQYFRAYEITEGDAVYNRINGKSYYANDNIGLSDLRYIKLVHYNFEHNVQVGELIVNAAIADDVINIFKELYDAEYEIQSMQLVDDFWTGDGDSSDSNSIDHNNTSAFCYRMATGGANLSNHAYGRAIDLNPQQNPYVWYDSNGQARWSHENANSYIDRSCGDPHVIVQGDTCYNIFTKYGFSWGGLWGSPVDYQHFEKKG